MDILTYTLPDNITCELTFSEPAIAAPDCGADLHHPRFKSSVPRFTVLDAGSHYTMVRVRHVVYRGVHHVFFIGPRVPYYTHGRGSNFYYALVDAMRRAGFAVDCPSRSRHGLLYALACYSPMDGVSSIVHRCLALELQQ